MSGLRTSCRSITANRYLKRLAIREAVSISSDKRGFQYSICTSSRKCQKRKNSLNQNKIAFTLPKGKRPSLNLCSSLQEIRFGTVQSKRSFSGSAICQQSTQEADNAKIVDYLLADVGEGITECEIVKWFVETGTRVEEFDNLVEVQSDKASVEITSRYTGTVIEHCYQVGQVAKVGSPLCRIRLEYGQDMKSELDGQSHSNETKDVNEEVKNNSDQVQEIEKRQESDTPFSSSRFKSLATPAVRRLTRENGVQIEDVRGTGKDGRVTKEDVQQFIASKSQDQQKEFHSPLHLEENASQFITESIPITGVRKAMFKAMSNTWTAPHFGYSDEIDVTELEEIRKRIAKVNGKGTNQIMKEEPKMTLLPFLLKALSITLNDHPLFRSILDTQSMSLKQAKEHRISIAFASSKGLLTPTLQGDVRSLSIIDIARQIGNLQSIGASRNLTQREMGSGATITLSNIGSIGGTHTFPLIPPTGQMIIGAIGRTRILPRFEGDPSNGKVRPATILPISFSADHRIVEGIELAKFVNDWKKLLEDPTSWIVKMH